MPQEGTTRVTNGDAQSATTAPSVKGKAKQRDAPAIDASEVHELLQSRIAALEGEKTLGNEEDKRSAEEARKTLKGMTLQQLHSKYVDLYQDFRRQEREHAKDRQKTKKDSDASKTALNNIQKLKAKTDAVVRDMQKQNKDLREETKRLKGALIQTEAQLANVKEELRLRSERDKRREKRYAEMPDIVVKVVCRYRAELFFKISRKTKLQRLFGAWTERMENKPLPIPGAGGTPGAGKGEEGRLQFMFTHMGRGVEPDMTPEDAGMEDGDEILAVEMMDLTGPEVEEVPQAQRTLLAKHWTDDPVEARRSIEDVFDGMVRERLKNLLRQYELREKHFDAIIRSKELEVMLSKARVSDYKAQIDQLDRDRSEIGGGMVGNGNGDGMGGWSAAQNLGGLQRQNNELMKKVDELQTSQRELVDQFVLCSTEVLEAFQRVQFLAASKGEAHVNIERSLMAFKALRDQMNAQWGITVSGAEITVRLSNGS